MKETTKLGKLTLTMETRKPLWYEVVIFVGVIAFLGAWIFIK